MCAIYACLHVCDCMSVNVCVAFNSVTFCQANSPRKSTESTKEMSSAKQMFARACGFRYTFPYVGDTLQELAIRICPRTGCVVKPARCGGGVCNRPSTGRIPKEILAMGRVK